MYDYTPQEFELLKKCLIKEAECSKLWQSAIELHPKLARHHKKFSELSCGEWAVILAYLPELAEFAPLQDFSIREWTYAIACQPQLAEKCTKPLTDQQKANIRQLREILFKSSQ